MQHPAAYQQRQASEIVLRAIAQLQPNYPFYLKGGMLMGLVHESPRETTNIDLPLMCRSPDTMKQIVTPMNGHFSIAAAEPGHAPFDVGIH